MKTRSEYRLFGLAGQMAIPGYAFPDRFDTTLPLEPHRILISRHMFKKEEEAAGFQHTKDLCQHGLQVRN